jgi:hypothetical protein
MVGGVGVVVVGSELVDRERGTVRVGVFFKGGDNELETRMWARKNVGSDEEKHAR